MFGKQLKYVTVKQLLNTYTKYIDSIHGKRYSFYHVCW